MISLLVLVFQMLNTAILVVLLRNIMPLRQAVREALDVIRPILKKKPNG